MGKSNPDYQRGIKCEWMGKSVADMPRAQLIAFIGMLDAYVEQMRSIKVDVVKQLGEDNG